MAEEEKKEEQALLEVAAAGEAPKEGAIAPVPGAEAPVKPEGAPKPGEEAADPRELAILALAEIDPDAAEALTKFYEAKSAPPKEEPPPETKIEPVFDDEAVAEANFVGAANMMRSQYEGALRQYGQIKADLASLNATIKEIEDKANEAGEDAGGNPAYRVLAAQAEDLYRQGLAFFERNIQPAAGSLELIEQIKDEVAAYPPLKRYKVEYAWLRQARGANGQQLLTGEMPIQARVAILNRYLESQGKPPVGGKKPSERKEENKMKVAQLRQRLGIGLGKAGAGGAVAGAAKEAAAKLSPRLQAALNRI